MNTLASETLAERWAKTAAQSTAPDGPAWLRDLRADALNSFSGSGLPHRKVEAWKYTPLKRLETASPDLPRDAVATASVSLSTPLISDPAAIVDVVDGGIHSAMPAAPVGVSLMTFPDALDRFESRLRGLAEQVDVNGPARAFAALNTAYIHRSTVIHVAAGVDAGTILTRWASSLPGTECFSPFRLFVLLDEGARLELIEQHQPGDGPAGALNLVVQADLGEKAELDHIRLQANDDEAFLLTATEVEQGAGSTYRYRGFDLGGGLVRHELATVLAGEESRADFAGAWVLDGSRHCDTRVSADHAARDCRSEQLFRGVLGGKSRGVFNGRALIREGADGSSVVQSNANLLLSRLAEMDTKPELEIYADEVEASHGATVGQLDETAVFYLRSRGLSEDEARRVLTAAFCHAVTERLGNRELAENIGRLIDGAMPQGQEQPGSE